MEMSCAVPRLIIAGVHSGVGKTTVTAGLTAALAARGLRVQPFKAGPDYIDPTYHRLAAGRPCLNLDTWMLPADAVRWSFVRGCQAADVAVIEGVAGLFDGFGYDEETGSTAHLAKLLEAPVVVLLDASKIARSAGAVALGMARYDPALRVAGFIANRVAGPAHGQGVSLAIERATGLRCFGWIPRLPDLHVPERHLGLVPTVEDGRWQEFVEAARRTVEAYVDVDTLLDLSRAAAVPVHAQRLQPQPAPGRARIAMARDEAFSFYYEDSLDMLRACGAEIVPFSPLRDRSLPDRVGAIYLGGGFPEVYAEALADNHSMRRALREAIEAGVPTYAECGGLMYLTEAIVDRQGRAYPMVGALPGRSTMTERVILGYRVVTARQETWLLRPGEFVRGHEFHYSSWEVDPSHAAYDVMPRQGGEARLEGYARGNLLASYIHLHLAAAPWLASRWATQAWAWQQAGGGT